MLATTMCATLATTRASFARPRSLGASVRPHANRRFARPVSSSPAPRRVRIADPGSAVSAANWPGLSDADDKKKSPGGGGGGGDAKKRDGKPRGGGKGGRGKSSGRGGGGRGNSTPNARGRGRGRGRGKPSRDVDVTADGSKAWRLFDVKLSLADDAGKDSFEVTPALRDAACAILGLPVKRTREDGRPLLCDGPGYGVRIVRKSCDARSVPPVFSYVLDVDDVAINSATVATGSIKPLKIRVRPKKCERVSPEWDDGGYDDAVAEAAEPNGRIDGDESFEDDEENVDDGAFDDGFADDAYDDADADADDDAAYSSSASSSSSSSSANSANFIPDDVERVVIVGLGPAGLFAALSLAEEGIPTTVLERGQPVESRGRDIGALFARRVLDPDSNLCYGEGGAGTWSDGKLTTRIGRNSDDVRSVLRALVAFGAPPEILVTGKPHLGTDRLVRILRNARGYLASRGVDLRFGQTVERVAFEPADDEGDGRVARAVGVYARTNRGEDGRGRGGGGDEGGPDANSDSSDSGFSDASFVAASAVILAAGHSARGLFEGMHEDGVELRYQSFAAGFRIEHPQALLDAAQYGAELAPLASRGRGPLPVADYRLAHQCVGPPGSGPAGDDDESDAVDGGSNPTGRACYSFCMCPGGQIVPTSTDPAELCVNGMSFSKRSSRWANSGLVSPVAEEDALPFLESPGREPLAGLDFQRHIERQAAIMGGGHLVAPVQTAPDFIAGRLSREEDLPPSSYRLGVKPARLDLLYPPKITEAVRESLLAFDAQIPGYAGPTALLHAPEARTSSPVRVVRSKADGMSTTAIGLFPAGEGAGYAGGIVSAAVDGLAAADAVEKFVAARGVSERGLGAWA